MANKTQATTQSVNEFLETLSESQKADAQTLIKIMRDVTDEAPKMWGANMVGFKSYNYKTGGRIESFFKVGFAPRKDQFSLYLIGIDYDLEAHQRLLEKLGKHTHGKGCLYIKTLSDVDLKVLEQLIETVANTKNEREI